MREQLDFLPVACGQGHDAIVVRDVDHDGFAREARDIVVGAGSGESMGRSATAAGPESRLPRTQPVSMTPAIAAKEAVIASPVRGSFRSMDLLM
jgi:hypothetical protein